MKMKLSGSTLIGGFAVLLAAYTAWDYQTAQQSIGMGSDEKKLFTLAPSDVDKVKVTRPGETVVLEKRGGEWQMLEPVQDAATGSSVDALVYSLVIQKGRTFRTEDGNQNPDRKEYGFDETATHLEVSGKGKTEELTVSNKNAFDGSYYISQGDAVYLGDRGLAQVVAKDSKTMRSRKLWRNGELEIEAVSVSLPALKESYNLKKSGTGWALEPAPKFKVDSQRMQNWIDELRDLGGNDLVVDKPTPDEKKKVQLTKPSFTTTVKYKNKEGKLNDWNFTTGQPIGDGIYGLASDPDILFKFTRGGLKNVRVTRDYFRDGRSPFRFPVEKAVEIEIRQNAFHHKFKKDGSEWKLAGDAAARFKFNPEKLVDLIAAIARIEAWEFFPSKDAKGFKDFEGITIRGAQGAELFKLTWGEEYPAKQSFNEGMKFRSVRTNLEADTMGIDFEKFKTLVDADLVTPVEKNSEKK